MTTLFAVSDLKCPCGKCILTPTISVQLQKLADKLNLVQRDVRIGLEEKGIAFEGLRCNSAYRCPEHNAAIGGAPGSQHMFGTAADIFCGDDTTRYELLDAAFVWNFTFIEICQMHVHMDLRDSPLKRLIIGKDA